jgi:hypothetical protein
MRASLEQGQPLSVQSLPRPGWEKPLSIRTIPAPPAKPPFLAHARLRRASPMTHYAVSAALEALAGDAERVKSGALRLGIIACTMNGGLTYSRRFYQEVLKDPNEASPLIFPETVFNAPASHLSAYLGSSTVSYTLVGDSGAFFQGLVAAAQWLDDNVADACIVIGMEEADWTAADALRLFERQSIHAAGAGAIYLKTRPHPTALVELSAVTDSFPVGRKTDADEAARKMRAQLPPAASNELLCSNQNANVAWSDWTGARLHPKTILGEGFVASAAWQCVAGCDAVQRGQYQAANVIITGANQQTIGARFVNTKY